MEDRITKDLMTVPSAASMEMRSLYQQDFDQKKPGTVLPNWYDLDFHSYESKAKRLERRRKSLAQRGFDRQHEFW